MKSRTKEKKGLPLHLVFACAGGTLALSGSVAAWLTTDQLAEQLWPGDINRAIVGFLGGSVEKNAAGELKTSLSLMSVCGRLLFVISTSLLVVRLRTTDLTARSELNCDALRKYSVIFMTSALWWPLLAFGEAFAPPVLEFCVSVLSLWLAVTVGFTAWVWISAVVGIRRDVSASDSSWPVRLVAVFTLLWISVSFWMNKCLYDQLLIPHGDSAMYEEHLWNVWHGKGFRSYLDQGLFLGEHIQVIHLLLLPLHIIWPSHLLLELAESVALGSCVAPIFLIVRRHTNSQKAAALVAIAWLFYYPMHFLDIAIDQKTFRPISLALPFLFWMLEFAERRQFGRMLCCLVIALSAKEDIALVICPMMAVLAADRWRKSQNRESIDTLSGDNSLVAGRWFLATSLATGVYLVAAVLVIIPAFRSGDHVHYARYFGDLGGTPSELIRTALSEPGRVLSRAFSSRTLLYVCVFLAPLGFLPLRRPLMLLAGVLTFGMLSLLELGDDGLPPVPFHHFHAPLVAVVFWAAAVGIGKLARKQAGRRHATAISTSLLVLCCSVASGLSGSLMPCGFSFWSAESPFSYSNALAPSDPVQQKRAKYVEAVVNRIPLTARVASTDYIHTRLTHCERSYDYSEYLRAVNNYQPGVPGDTDFIVIDTGHRYSEVKSASDLRELREEADRWELLPDETDGTFLILKRLK